MELKKMELTSASGSDINLEALYQIMPSAFTEVCDEKTGEISHKINFSTLRELLGDNAYEGADEEYGFKWVGKNAARREAARPINKTLRPCPEESVDWENTQNIYIEGDNLEVLKLLQKSYLGKIKMIYIDPPYNTGNDFVYRDDFAMNADEYDIESGNVDELGNRYRKNNDSNARFHSDWCSMIYERLLVSRALLSDDGVIFISIDENEIENLKKICNEVFGDNNFVDVLHWKKKKQPSFLAKHTAKVMEYVLVYAKNWNNLEKLSIESLSDATKKVINLTNNDSIRHFNSGVRVKIGDSGIIKAGTYKIRTMDVQYLTDIPYENGRTLVPVDVRSKFSVSQEKIDSFIAEDLLFITANYGLRRDVSAEESEKRKSITDLLLAEYGDNQESDNEFKELFDVKYFDYTKPIALIYNFVKCNFTENNIILDFFSGSATTAHAVMKLNADDGGNRRYIMVQLPEKTDEKSEAYKAGYENICEIGKERIRRAGEKIRNEELGKRNGDNSSLQTPNSKLDTGFRVFKCADSNMENVYFTPSEYSQDMLTGLIDNVKIERNDLDLLFGCMLDWGVQLSLPLSNIEVNGKKIHIVNNGDLVACFENDIDEDIISAIAEQSPLRVVFRDSCFRDIPMKMNLFEIFKQKCGWSEEIVKNRVHVI